MEITLEAQTTINKLLIQKTMDEIIKELRSMRLPAMAQMWNSLAETKQLDRLTLCDGLRMLLQAEKDARLTNRNQRLIKQADFRYNATMEQIDANNARGIDPNMLAVLSTGAYIDRGESVLITGAAGTGKSYLAIALGNKACYQGYHVNYFNMHKLLAKLKMARMEGSIMRFMAKVAQANLLIIDDFGMRALEGQQQNDLMEIMEDRHNRKATIVISQLPVSDWHDVIGNVMIADAILDRIAHTSHRFALKGDSLRKNK